MTKTLSELAQEIEEYEQGFNTRWNADMRAITHWRNAHPGNDLVAPDHVDLCTWLLDQLVAKDSEIVQLHKELDNKDEEIIMLISELESKEEEETLHGSKKNT